VCFILLYPSDNLILDSSKAFTWESTMQIDKRVHDQFLSERL